MDETHFQVGLHHKLEKEKTKCDTKWRSMRGNNEGLNFPLHLAKKFTWFNNWSFGIIWELLRGLGW